MKKDFSVIKWLIFPALAFGCAIGIGHSSKQMFGYEGSVLYFILLGSIVLISLILVLQTGNKTIRAAIIAAFTFETVGLIALIITCITCVSVSRKLAGVKQSSDQTIATVEAIGSLKSVKAQANVTKGMVLVQTDLSKASADAEDALYYPLIFEVSVYFIGLMTVFGINLFLQPQTDIEPDIFARFTQSTSNASLRITKLKQPLSKAKPIKFESGNGIESFTLYPQTSGYRVHNQASAYVGHISHRRFNQLSPKTYDDVKGMLGLALLLLFIMKGMI